MALIQQYQHNSLAKNWFKIGLLSLALAGIYSIILVILRTPQLSVFFSSSEIFRTALVIHVNLSVLVWLLSITAAIWSYDINNTSQISRFLLILAFVGTILMAASPIFGNHHPVMNNYIPMLQNITFILGLTLFGISILLFSLPQKAVIKTPINIAILTSKIMFLLVWVCFTCSYLQINKIIKLVPMDIELYYELLFWSGGHLLQFVYTQILIIIWLILFECWIGKNLRFQKFYALLLGINFILSLPIIAGHFFYDIIDGEFKDYFTQHMKYCAGIAPVLSLFLMCYEKLSMNPHKNDSLAACSSIICSSALFLFGGLIAIRISGVNLVIPAHYHGSIVGITIAFMGFGYLLTKSDSSKIFTISIYILTCGQILHISGLALSGGYGVLRKTPGSEMVASAKLFMGMMGGGGLLAIVGGLMFVYICGRNVSLR